MTSPETKVSAFVHWKHIANVMQQANTDGVKCTLLMKPSGSLLVIVGDKSVEKIMGPFVSSMWKSYSVRGYKAFGARPLKLMMVDCQKGKLVITSCSKFILAMHASPNVELGLLRSKLEAISSSLASSLSRPRTEVRWNDAEDRVSWNRSNSVSSDIISLLTL